MADQSAERDRFTEMRARALANILLLGREDLSIQDLAGADLGLDYLCTVRSDTEGLRQFAVTLRATYSPVTEDTANKVLRPTLAGLSRIGPFPYPTVLFYYTMMESQAWSMWVMEPVRQPDGTMRLEMQREARCRPLDDKALAQIITCVDLWYDSLFTAKAVTSEPVGKRPAKGATRPTKNQVVITEIDGVTFDYSDAILRLGELLEAVLQCSNYIVKTYPTPLSTLQGKWDLVKDERGRAVVTLTVTDETTRQSATARFTRKDVQDPAAVYSRFDGLFGDILHPG